MNVTLFISGFWLGTFKFLFSHWATFAIAAGMSYQPHYYEIFASATTGAWVSMAFFYFSSSLLLKRAARKRHERYELALRTGVPLPKKKLFTRTNKTLVRMKRSMGIVGITIFAPLFLSIPIGSIVCAKFFGHDKRTFPLMLLFTAAYSFIMCFLIYLLQ